ncbi:MAG: hypothetical protein M1825_001291 [Sarcosagium campestre]|nr:MAG: hypothetical protein M1825_001291 [Sarcosagium campestre]
MRSSWIQTIESALLLSTTRPRCLLFTPHLDRPFSASHRADASTRGKRLQTLNRRRLFRWLQGPGAAFKEPLPGSTNYLGAYDNDGNPIRRRDEESDVESKTDEGTEEAPTDNARGGKGRSDAMVSEREKMPFPLNTTFKSQPVLDEEMREEIYNRVKIQGKSVKVVSAEQGVEMSRVAAVVRLKALEKEWEKEGKPLARAYSKAVLSMLPRTSPGRTGQGPHESINDLPAHPATMQQIFHPVSESRAFTRADAASVFDPDLLPADARIPHPELIEMERDRQAGVDRRELYRKSEERAAKEQAEREARDERRKRWVEQNVTRVAPSAEGGVGGRWEWRFSNISVQDVGKDGRAAAGTGWRYGVPHADRKKSHVKIPTHVR